MSANELDTEKINNFVSAPRFHQHFTFNCQATNSEFKVTYSVAGIQQQDAPTVLYHNGMYGGRLNGAWVDFLAEKKGVRMISCDRPGVGGTTAVPLAQRVIVWLEIVPALLSHLGITHVSLASHSCGAIYLLNTVHHLPHILNPENPAIFLLAPWVHPSKSGVKMLAIASALPSGVLSGWNKLITFMVNSAIPALDKPAAMFSSLMPKSNKKTAKSAKVLEEEERIFATCGLTFQANDKTREICTKMYFAEEHKGASEELTLALKVTGDALWGACEDYDSYVSSLTDVLKKREERSTLQVRAYHAETDLLIGKGGQKFFDECWTKRSVSDVISYHSEEIPKTDHDSVTFPEFGAVGRIFDETRKSVRGSEEDGKVISPSSTAPEYPLKAQV